MSSCLSLVPPSHATAAAASMTGTALMLSLRSQKFFSTLGTSSWAWCLGISTINRDHRHQNYARFVPGNPYRRSSAPPFSVSVMDQGISWTLGFASLTAGGRIMWGLSCPDGAIVASTPRTLQSPDKSRNPWVPWEPKPESVGPTSHCLQVGAGSETVHEVLSGSAMCPPGTAVSGWQLGS